MDFQRLRKDMVKEQISARGFTDKGVLDAMQRVPRHEFIPKNVLGQAYRDRPVPIGEGQTISQPYMNALMTQCLSLNKEKRVFEVGTGSGYQAAILAELSKEVYSIERIETLFYRARRTLHKLKYKNVKTFLGDGSLGLPDESQLFDAIIITAASPNRPDNLFSQLAIGGCLAAPVGDRFNQILTLFTKTKDQIIEKTIVACTFVPLVGKYGWSPSQ